MKSPHPDKATKGLIILDLSLFIMIISSTIFYYRLLDNGYNHNESLMFSFLIGIVFVAILSSFTVNKYILKKKEVTNESK